MHKEIGMRIGKSREYVANSIRLLGLPEEAKTALREGRITESHARYLLTLQEHPQQQKILLDDIVLKGLNVRDVERMTKEIIAKEENTKSNAFDPETKNMEEALSRALGARVYISKSGAGGRVSLEFFTPEELSSFVERFAESQKLAQEEPIPTETAAPVELASFQEGEEFTI